MKGKFILFEGPDGCGKSSMVEATRRHLEVKGMEAVFVQDPGGTPIGQQLRKVLLNKDNAEMCAMTELLLYVASRAQLVAETIKPALDEGKTVIADRFFLSTLVYQGVAGAMPEEQLKEIVKLGTESVKPDHVILLDVPADIGLARVGKERDRMELKGLRFFEEVRQRYLGYADAMPESRLTIVDAARPILEVKKDVLDLLDALL